MASAVVVAVVAGCRPQPPTKECLNDQSPRRLENYSNRPSFVVDRAPASDGDAVFYTRRSDGRRWLLKRCGQHYHCQVENVQPACRQESSTRECGEPTPDSWVEIHTLYAEKMATGNCDPEETPGCCETEAEGDPILVMAFHAKVTREGSPLHPIPLPWGAATARWSGSTTGTKEPLLCKPPAQWNFLLGCNFTVSQEQIRLFRHIEQARLPQHQLSDDLTYQPPR